MSRRQSDGRIVPMKAGNAAGGKPREGCSSQPCHTEPYREDDRCRIINFAKSRMRKSRTSGSVEGHSL